MKKQIKYIIGGIALFAVTIGGVYAFNMPKFIDNLNEQDIKLSYEQDKLTKLNNPLREKIKNIENKLEENSNKWNNIQGQREQIKAIIRTIENEGL